MFQESVELRKNKVGISGLWQRGPKKALLISLYLLIIQQGSGNNAIISFAEYIFEMGHIAVTGSMCAIIGGFTNLVGGIMTPFVVRKFSMKTSFLISAFGVAITLVNFVCNVLVIFCSVLMLVCKLVLAYQ